MSRKRTISGYPSMDFHYDAKKQKRIINKVCAGNKGYIAKIVGIVLLCLVESFILFLAETSLFAVRMANAPKSVQITYIVLGMLLMLSPLSSAYQLKRKADWQFGSPFIQRKGGLLVLTPTELVFSYQERKAPASFWKSVWNVFIKKKDMTCTYSIKLKDVESVRPDSASERCTIVGKGKLEDASGVHDIRNTEIDMGFDGDAAYYIMQWRKNRLFDATKEER